MTVESFIRHYPACRAFQFNPEGRVLGVKKGKNKKD